ncbi:MAG: cytochrome c biogenesis CcdA family protein [Nitrospinota bacterium]
MSIGQAFFGGVSSFFSVWVFCLLQITPFLLAFIVGATVKSEGDNPSPSQWKKILLISLIPLIGFTLTFVPMGMTTTAVSKIIFRYLELANQFGGVIIGLIGCYLIGWLSVTEASPLFTQRLVLGAGFLLGGSLALAYKPCITPTLTVILNLTNTLETANIGGVMLAFYTLGVSTVILIVGFALAAGFNRLHSVFAKTIVKKFCGVVLLTVSFLILSGMMTDYKSFLVGRFVPMAESMPTAVDMPGEMNRQ